MTLPEGLSLNPLHFFALSADCVRVEDPHGSLREDQWRLPSTEFLSGEEAFATLFLAWHETGIAVEAVVEEPVTYTAYPSVREGDSLELFIDCRDVKTSGFNTRFCHHFFFLPEPVKGVSLGEITHFRTEDSHELADANALSLKVQEAHRGYSMKIFIPRECLHGYDPEEFRRMGFSYRVNRNGKPSQHFSALTDDFLVEQQPSLWSSLNLTF